MTWIKARPFQSPENQVHYGKYSTTGLCVLYFWPEVWKGCAAISLISTSSKLDRFIHTQHQQFHKNPEVFERHWVQGIKYQIKKQMRISDRPLRENERNSDTSVKGDMVVLRPVSNYVRFFFFFYLSPFNRPDVILCGWLGSKHQLTHSLSFQSICDIHTQITTTSQLFLLASWKS